MIFLRKYQLVLEVVWSENSTSWSKCIWFKVPSLIFHSPSCNRAAPTHRAAAASTKRRMQQRARRNIRASLKRGAAYIILCGCPWDHMYAVYTCIEDKSITREEMLQSVASASELNKIIVVSESERLLASRTSEVCVSVIAIAIYLWMCFCVLSRVGRDFSVDTRLFCCELKLRVGAWLHWIILTNFSVLVSFVTNIQLRCTL